MNEATLFALALEKESGDLREAFLAEACADDETLRRRVDVLLRAHAQSDDILGPAGERTHAAAFSPITEKAGSHHGGNGNEALSTLARQTLR